MAKVLYGNDINSITMSGTVVTEPQFWPEEDGKPALLKFRMVSNRNYRVGEEWKEQTTGIGVQIRGPVAVNKREQIKKLSVVVVEGALRANNWVDDDGVQQYSYVIDSRGTQTENPDVFEFRTADRGDSAPAKASSPGRSIVDDGEEPF